MADLRIGSLLVTSLTNFSMPSKNWIFQALSKPTSPQDRCSDLRGSSRRARELPCCRCGRARSVPPARQA